MTNTPLMTFSALFWLTAPDAVDTSLKYFVLSVDAIVGIRSTKTKPV